MNKKIKCPKCNKVKTTKCFQYNPVEKRLLCRMCHKKVGTNIFYKPKSSIKKSIGKFNMTDDEKKVLASTKGWDRVNKDCRGLNTIKKRVQWDKRRKIKEERVKKLNKELQKKKFIEGLK